MQSGPVRIKAAVALAPTVEVDGPINRIRPVGSVLWMLTVTAATPPVDKFETPGMTVGKLTVTTSEAMPPNPLRRA